MSNEVSFFLIISFLILIILNELKFESLNFIKSKLNILPMFIFTLVAYMLFGKNESMFSLAAGLSVYSGLCFIRKIDFDISAVSLLGASLLVTEVVETNTSLLVLSVLFCFSYETTLAGKIVKTLLLLSVLLDQFNLNINQNLLSLTVLLILVIHALSQAIKTKNIESYNLLYYLSCITMLNHTSVNFSQPIILIILIITLTMLKLLNRNNFENITLMFVVSVCTLLDASLSWMYMIILILYNEMGGKLENVIYKKINIKNLVTSLLLTMISMPLLGWWSMLLCIPFTILLMADGIVAQSNKLSSMIITGCSIVVVSFLITVWNLGKYEFLVIFPLCVLSIYILEKYFKELILESLSVKYFNSNYFSLDLQSKRELGVRESTEKNDVVFLRFNYNLVAITFVATTALLLTIIWNNKWN
jgi:hypothetical protein